MVEGDSAGGSLTGTYPNPGGGGGGTKSFTFFATIGGTTRTIMPIDVSCTVSQIAFNWTSTATTGTVKLEKLTGSTAPGGGNSLLASPTSTTGNQHAPIFPTLTSTTADLSFVKGDRIGIVASGQDQNLTFSCTVTF